MKASRWIVPVVMLALLGVLIFGLTRPATDPPSVLVGKPAPALTLPDYSGQTHTISEYRGKPVVINFWASWCVPCHAEAPILADLSAKAGGSVQFLGVLYNDKTGQDRAFSQQYGLTYPTLLDPGSKAAMSYGIGQLPDTFIVDSTGKIVYHQLGALSDSPAILQNFKAALVAAGGRL